MKRIFETVKTILDQKANAVIAIDGCCASGKTTLANRLAEEFGAQVISMDDFFLPPDMRTHNRLSQPGGNVHYERFVEEVVIPLQNNKQFYYRVFNCKAGSYTDTKSITPNKAVIIEGAYSLHPEIYDVFDLKIFLDAPLETRLKRIRERNGEEALEAFKTKWIPFENHYFEAFDIKNKCDLIIENE